MYNLYTYNYMYIYIYMCEYKSIRMCVLRKNIFISFIMPKRYLWMADNTGIQHGEQCTTVRKHI